MSPPGGTPAVGGRPQQQRPNKKSNGTPRNHSSPASQILLQQPISDGKSDSTPQNQNRRPRKNTNPPGQNGQQGTPNGGKQKHHQRIPSQPQSMSPAIEVTPSKAYAGPHFHASPAPSSLPMPKMFSKNSTDSTSSLPSAIIAEESDAVPTDQEEPKNAKTMTPDPKAREPSPLDFLFDAARQARSSSNASQTLKLRSGNLTPSEESTPTRRHATPTNVSGTFFPFELDGSNGSANEIGPAFATPYQERMSHHRARDSPRQTSDGNLNESERLAKTEGLKRLLGHQASPSPSRSPGLDNQRPTNQRHSSGPSLNHYGSSASSGPNGWSYTSGGSPNYSESPFRDIPVQRPTSSKLRQQISPGVPDHHAFTPIYDTPSPSRTPRATVDAKKLEDDLRRVLKLDLTS